MGLASLPATSGVQADYRLAQEKRPSPYPLASRYLIEEAKEVDWGSIRQPGPSETSGFPRYTDNIGLGICAGMVLGGWPAQASANADGAGVQQCRVGVVYTQYSDWLRTIILRSGRVNFLGTRSPELMSCPITSIPGIRHRYQWNIVAGGILPLVDGECG